MPVGVLREAVTRVHEGGGRLAVHSQAKAVTEPDSSRTRWYVAGASVHGELTAAAVETGVTVLAG